MTRATAASLVMILMTACSNEPPRIDGSSSESARASIVKVRESISESHRAEFDRSLDIVMRSGAEPPLLRDERVRRAIDRKTAAEVIAAAVSLTQESKTKTELAAIRAAFGRMSDREGVTATVAPPLTPEEQRAKLWNAKLRPSTADREVQVFCMRRFGGVESAGERECEDQQMSAKKYVTGALNRHVPTDVAGRIRTTCAQDHPDDYVQRLWCEERSVREAAHALQRRQ
jgi:hypothetical protein